MRASGGCEMGCGNRRIVEKGRNEEERVSKRSKKGEKGRNRTEVRNSRQPLSVRSAERTAALKDGNDQRRKDKGGAAGGRKVGSNRREKGEEGRRTCW